MFGDQVIKDNKTLDPIKNAQGNFEPIKRLRIVRSAPCHCTFKGY